MTAVDIPRASHYECSCGAVFPNDIAAYRHRDRQPLDKRPQHTVSRINTDANPKTAPKPAAVQPAPDTAVKVIWKDPPAARRGRPFVVDRAVLDTLKANPGRWALVHTYPNKSSASTAAKRVRSGDSIGTGWEARSSTLSAGSELYLRWVGETGDQ